MHVDQHKIYATDGLQVEYSITSAGVWQHPNIPSRQKVRPDDGHQERHPKG